MRLSNLRTAIKLSSLEILTNRIVALLFFIIPFVFYGLTVITTKNIPLFFKLASVVNEPMVQVSQQGAAIVFIGLTSVGLLAAFVAMYLIQKNSAVNRRLILCGFSRVQLILSKLILMLVIIFIVSGFISLLALFFLKPVHFFYMWGGFMLIAYVYGCYGLVVGSIFKRELEGILFVILLVNVDVGWLQNPVYYEGAQNKIIIRHLPAFFPSQMSMIAAFSDFSFWAPLLEGLLYGTIFLAIALLMFKNKMKIFKR